VVYNEPIKRLVDYLSNIFISQCNTSYKGNKICSTRIIYWRPFQM